MKMGMRGSQKTAANMGDLLQDRYNELRYIDKTVTGVGIEEGGKFWFSIVNV